MFLKKSPRGHLVWIINRQVSYYGIMFKLILFFFVFHTFGAHVMATSNYISRISVDEVNTIVNEALQTFNVPGAALGLVIDDEIILSQGYGVRKVNEQSLVTEQTSFPIASCTKAFTALLLGQLVDEGKISLDDLVIKHIPEISSFHPAVAINLTIRDLLAHRTGMARHDPIWLYLKIARSEIIPRLSHCETVCGLREEFKYNNFMYAIAGIIIEKVTGESWEEALHSRILKPLKMVDTNTSIEQLKKKSNYSSPHAEIMGKAVTIPFRDLHAINPGGGINSNIIDMTKWVRFHLSENRSKDLIQTETLKEMQTMQITFSSYPNNCAEVYQSGYGLGWFIGKYREHQYISHGGNIDGFASDVSLLPTQGIGLIILTNSGNNGRYVISSVRNQIFDKILRKEDVNWPHKMQEAQDKARIEMEGFLEDFKRTTEIFHPVESLKEFVGLYEHPSYGVFDLSINHDHLLATYGEAKIPLYYKSENVFSGQWDVLLYFGINPIIDITFFKDEEGEIQKIEVPFEFYRSAKPITFKRLN